MYTPESHLARRERLYADTHTDEHTRTYTHKQTHTSIIYLRAASRVVSASMLRHTPQTHTPHTHTTQKPSALSH